VEIPQKMRTQLRRDIQNGKFNPKAQAEKREKGKYPKDLTCRSQERLNRGQNPNSLLRGNKSPLE